MMILAAESATSPRKRFVHRFTLPLPRKRPVLADMQVIVRLQDRGALRLDHLHDQALCEPEERADLLITHIMPRSALWTGADQLADEYRASPDGVHRDTYMAPQINARFCREAVMQCRGRPQVGAFLAKALIAGLRRGRLPSAATGRSPVLVAF